MLVSMHWRSGNPHLDAEKGDDAALKFQWRFWRWS